MRRRDLGDELNQITFDVIGTAIEVHRELGPGLLERVYQGCLATALMQRDQSVLTELPLRATFRGVPLEPAYRLDMLIADRVVVEVKAVDEVVPLHLAQLRTYLRLGRYPVGLLINFNTPHLRDGVHRVVNTGAR